MKHVITLVLLIPALLSGQDISGHDQMGKYSYDQFEKPTACRSCHTDLFYQWDQAMMSKAYTHHWDEIEYFNLAVPHDQNTEQMRGVSDGCNGCHTPIAFLAGDVPPPRPEEGSRANESVSCDVCHTITGFRGDTPFNYNYTIEPGRTKFGPKQGKESPHHNTEYSEFITTAEYCGTCHNEKSPFGTWVKATEIELREGPYGEEGVVCQDCHVPRSKAISAAMSADSGMVGQHLFHGAHSPGKLHGVVELRMNPRVREAGPGETVKFSLQLFNQKTGHKFPTGSAEERVVWVHVEATDANGDTYHLPVDKKGFQGEEYTIASDTLAYQDMGVPLELPDFQGIRREDVPIGDRIFRLPYLDPQGRQTIMQWNTKSFGPDYRIGPRETKIETYTWMLPDEVPLGRVTLRAEMYYRKLPVPVQEFLEVPAEESEKILINSTETYIEVIDTYY
ncbi:MAG TPA: multiheme c-type cytochrome [bacterium]|nr:multiheme c-type cytochrome [bacterium]